MPRKPPRYESKTEYRRNRYRINRLKLIYAMGGKCHYCGEDDPLLLEFHHTKPRSWQAAKTSRIMRLVHCRREWERGEVVLACKCCNKKLGPPPVENEEPSPF